MMRSIVTLTVMAVLALAVGCTGGPKKLTEPEGHPTAGPHGGPLAEWGNEDYHAEFTVDRDKKEARVYILGPDAKTLTALQPGSKVLLSIKDPMFQVELKPEPQSGDPPGGASCFVGKEERFGKEQKFAGTISGEVNKKQYSGDFEQKAEGGEHKEKETKKDK